MRPLQGEGRDDDLAAPFGGAINRRGQGTVDFLDGRVQAIAIGALHHETVDAAGNFRLAQDGQALAAQVHCKGDARVVFLEVQHHHRAAQHMAGVQELEHHSGGDLLAAPIGQGHHLAQQRGDIVVVVERLRRLHVQVFALDQLLNVPGVGFLNHGCVEQHGPAQVAGRGCGVDGAMVAPLGQQGQGARVVDMRV